jgi:hypothetical protein
MIIERKRRDRCLPKALFCQIYAMVAAFMSFAFLQMQLINFRIWLLQKKSIEYKNHLCNALNIKVLVRSAAGGTL